MTDTVALIKLRKSWEGMRSMDHSCKYDVCIPALRQETIYAIVHHLGQQESSEQRLGEEAH